MTRSKLIAKRKIRWTNRDLLEHYNLYNEWYFGGRLPVLKIIRFGNLGPMLGHTSRYRKHKGRRSKEDQFGIVISRREQYSRRHWLPTLIHEAVHVEQRLRFDCGPRGKKFNDRMRELAVDGAFDGIW